MAKKRFVIQLDEEFLDGRIAANPNAFKLFLYLLRCAEREPRKMERLTLERGCILTNKAKLQKEVGMNMQPLRTALQILSKLGELTMLKIGRDTIYCLPNYERFCGRVTRNYQETNKILTTSATTSSTTLLTTSEQPKKLDFNRVSRTSENGVLTTSLTTFATTSATTNQQESNNFTTVSERENEKETEKEKAQEKDKEKVYIYNTHSLSARAREESGDVKDTHENIPQDMPGYGRYGNVRLTPDEYSELCCEFGEDVTNGAIDILDGHIKKRGAAFRSECHAVDIREWCVSKYQRLQAEKAALEKITPQKYPLNGGGSYIRMVTRVTGVERALTRPELACVDRWEADGISEDLLTLAYEKTVAKINKPQFAYMDKMLAGWQEKGLSTSGEVDAYFKNPENRLLGGAASDGRLDFELDEIFEKP